MHSKSLLRTAAALLVVHLLGHIMGHLSWDSPEDSNMQAVVDTMKSYSANFMGATKSMADYFNGYSLMIFGLFGSSVILLLLASQVISSHRQVISRLLLPIGAAFLYFGIVEYVYFFPFAASMSFLAGTAILLAATLVRK